MSDTKLTKVDSESETTNNVPYDAKTQRGRDGHSLPGQPRRGEPNDSISAYRLLKSSSQVKRKINVGLKAGQNNVEVTNLPNCLEESSIRVDGIGKCDYFRRDFTVRSYQVRQRLQWIDGSAFLFF